MQAALAPAALAEAVPQRFKLGAPDDVDKLVLSATGGVRLVHAPQVPAAIPVRPDACPSRGRAAPAALRAHAHRADDRRSLRASQLPELRLELFAVNP